MSLLHQKDPNVPFYWTEGGPFIDEADYTTGWAKWGGMFPMCWRTGAAVRWRGT